MRSWLHLLPICLLTSAAVGKTTSEINNCNKKLSRSSSLGFISKKSHNHHLLSLATVRSFASPFSSRGFPYSSRRNRGPLQRINLKQDKNTMDNQTEKILQTIHIFGANLILQVFGGAGAIWGFSEVVGLRTPSTVRFWRPCAAFFGVAFFARWVLQLKNHLEKEELFFGRHKKRQVKENAEEYVTEESKLLMTERLKNEEC